MLQDEHLHVPILRGMLVRMWKHLNHDIDANDETISPSRHILARLGDYAALIIDPLNLRPTEAVLQMSSDRRIEVRISTRTTHVMLVIAPQGDLAAEVFWLRSLATAHLSVPRLIAFDLERTLVPFTYAVESYVCGTALDRLADGPLMKVAARQIGRTLRRAHQIGAPGFGHPTANGRWPARTWKAALREHLLRHDLFVRAVDVLGTEQSSAFWAATLDHPALHCEQPRIIHGAMEPARAIVTVGDNVQLEALTLPDELVAGDPLFDIAHALLPHHPASFRQGLMEGYLVAGPLSPEQEQRLARLTALLTVAHALRHADQGMLEQLPGAVAALVERFGPHTT